MNVLSPRTFAAVLSVFALISLAARCGAEPVSIHKVGKGWTLAVNGKPLYIKGVGCNEAVGQNGEDYLKMAKEMGANSVRTWGGAKREYLDAAQNYGLKVDLGFWLNPVRLDNESYKDAGYRGRMMTLIVDYVREMKDHPALLSWNIGNEVFAYTEAADERQAFGEFLETAVQRVHEEDPNHPVIYSASHTRDLPDVQKYVPSIDIVGVNIYGPLSSVISWMDGHHFNRPLLVTEFGPALASDVAKDKNDTAFDPYDSLKASEYAAHWREIEAAKGRVLGGYAFVLGEQRNQDSYTWFNLNLGEDRRQGYWTLYELYTGKPAPMHCPAVHDFRIAQSTGIISGDTFSVRYQASDPDGDPLSFRYLITDVARDALVVKPPAFYPPRAEALEAGHVRLRAPDNPGTYRVYVIAADPKRNVAVADRTINVVPR